jgi:hypothetical protein
LSDGAIEYGIVQDRNGWFRLARRGPANEYAFVATVYKKMNQAAEQLSSAPASNAKLVGIGGWLLLLIVKLWVGVAVRVLAGISEQSHAVALLNFGFAAFAAIAAYLLGRKHPKGVILAKILLAAEAVY